MESPSEKNRRYKNWSGEFWRESQRDRERKKSFSENGRENFAEKEKNNKLLAKFILNLSKVYNAVLFCSK